METPKDDFIDVFVDVIIFKSVDSATDFVIESCPNFRIGWKMALVLLVLPVAIVSSIIKWIFIK